MWLAICVTMLLAVSLIDFVSGPELTFSLFYLAVMALYAWATAAFRRAVIVALGIATAWLIVERATLGSADAAILAWNASTRLIGLLALAALICRLRSMLFMEQSLARHDFLTGTLNARAFSEKTGQEILRARRFGSPLTVAYVDVDDFKSINDRFGHSYGDHVLRTIAKTLSENLRQTDTVARLRGDEFVILLPATNSEQARTVLSKLHDALSTAPALDLKVTLSIGAVVYDEPPSMIESLKNASDRAMYDVKSGGKNGLCIRSIGSASAV